MLTQMLADSTGFIANERVKGALFKSDICSIPDMWCMGGFNMALTTLIEEALL